VQESLGRFYFALFSAALDWTGRVLGEEPPDEEASSIATRAEMLTGIAAAEGVPIEVFFQWIPHARSWQDMER
jgi:hypothetical protein